MKYFKNIELAKFYHVSEKSVRNWIDGAKEGRLPLELYETGDKAWIANTTKNRQFIEELVQKGQKYKNTRGHKTIYPTEDFYKVFNANEIFSIISSLDIHHEIPLEYSYFDGGAVIWDEYVKKLAQDGAPNVLSSSIYLLELNETYICDLLDGCNRVNVVDIGPGNCYPVRTFLQHLVSKGKLNRYIGIDASRTMLDIAERNLRDWFGTSIHYEMHVRDITHERFGDLLTEELFDKDDITRNIVMLLGSTISNFRDARQPLTTIRESMGKDDLLIFTKQLDTPHSRLHFDYYTDSDGLKSTLAPKSKNLVSWFNIDESLYDAEMFFDETTMERRCILRLKVALSIEFVLHGKPKVIHFNKGDGILIWRNAHQNVLKTIQLFDDNGFDLLQATATKDREFMLSISKIKTAE